MHSYKAKALSTSSNGLLTPYDGDVLSAFASIAYIEDAPPVPEGYTWLCDCPKKMQSKDYFGTAYYRQDPESGIIDVVIAHRGTVNSAYNVLDDLRILLKSTPKAWEEGSKPFTDYVVNLINTTFPKSTKHYAQVGHSLGAIHADLCFAYQAQNTALDTLQCVTFENPGSKPMIEDLVKDKTFKSSTINDICHQAYIYNADVNAINSCNKQLGKTIFPCKVGYQFQASDLSPVTFEYYLANFTVDQHHIANFYNLFHTQPPVVLNQQKTWSAGIQAGFDYYRLYTNHPDYWDLALKNYWDNCEAVRNTYENDYDAYHKDMIDTYLSEKVIRLKESSELEQLEKSDLRANSIFKDFVIIKRENNNNTEQNDFFREKSRCIII